MLDKLIKLTTFLSTILIFNGVLYLTVYYQSFGIKIFSYLQFSEILTVFLDSLNTILMFFLIYIIHAVFSVYLFFKEEEAENRVVEKEQNKFQPNSNSAAIFVVILIVIISLPFVVGYFKINLIAIYVLLFLILNLFSFALHKVDNILLKTLDTNDYKLIQNIALFVIPFTLFTFAIAVFDAKETKQSAQKITIINKSDYPFYAGKYNKLIGKTNNYIFLYDSDSQNSMSVSLADVKSIEYH